MTSSRGIKVTLGGIAAAVGLLVTISPYLSMKEKVEHLSEEIKILKYKKDIDHDLLVKVVRDMDHVRVELSGMREDIKDIKKNMSMRAGIE